MSETKLLTAESVTEGHPDKLADRISDSIVDAALKLDPKARVAAEVLVTKGVVFVVGEYLLDHQLNIEEITRQAIREVGYTAASGFDPDNVAVVVSMHRQWAEIIETMKTRPLPGLQAHRFDERAAGDQGTVIGYATNETPELMPLPISIAHKITRRLAEARTSGVLPWLRPDGKAQVTLRYEGDEAVAVDTVLVSTQHDPEVEPEEIWQAVTEWVILSSLPGNLDRDGAVYLVNPAGSFVMGGPGVDSGLTGRKLVVDSYGPQVPVGGGAFSGKDATKVDRTGAYYARYVARQLVMEGLAERAIVEVSYAIGDPEPVAIRVDPCDTGVVIDAYLSRVVKERYDFRPLAIVERLGLERPIYTPTSSYGHFGRSDFPWEQRPEN